MKVDKKEMLETNEETISGAQKRQSVVWVDIKRPKKERKKKINFMHWV